MNGRSEEKKLGKGVRVRADFRYSMDEPKKLEEGVLVGKIREGLWVIDFEEHGLMLAGIEPVEELGFEDDVLWFQGDLAINPTNPDDWKHEEMATMLQLLAGKPFSPRVDVEGGLFLVKIVESTTATEKV